VLPDLHDLVLTVDHELEALVSGVETAPESATV
jgi:hypothetical protein